MNIAIQTNIIIVVFIALTVIVSVLLIMVTLRDKRPIQPGIDTAENYIKKLMARDKPEFTYSGTNTPVWEGYSAKGTVTDVFRTKIIKQATENVYLNEIDWVLVGMIVNCGWRLKHNDIHNLRRVRADCFQKPGKVEKWAIYNYALQMNRVLDRNYINVYFSDILEECFGVGDENKNTAEQYIKDYNYYIGNNTDGLDGHGLRVKCKRLYDYCEMYTIERELFSRERPTSDYCDVVKNHREYVERMKKSLKEFMFRFSRNEEIIDISKSKEWKQEDLYIAIMCNKRQLARHALVNNPEKVNKIINPPPPPKPRDPHDEYMDWLNGFTGIQSP